MEPSKEQFYLRRIAELEKQVAELLAQVARLSKNSSNSSKPPSSDIVKPPKPDNPKEPRTHCFVSHVGKVLLLLKDLDSVGVLLDVGHSLQGGENVAEAAALLSHFGKLDYVHLNDNYRTWDDDMMVGSVHLVEYLELVYWLKRLDYKDWLTLDIFPYREDGVQAATQCRAWMEAFFAANIPWQQYGQPDVLANIVIVADENTEADSAGNIEDGVFRATADVLADKAVNLAMAIGAAVGQGNNVGIVELAVFGNFYQASADYDLVLSGQGKQLPGRWAIEGWLGQIDKFRSREIPHMPVTGDTAFRKHNQLGLLLLCPAYEVFDLG